MINPYLQIMIDTVQTALAVYAAGRWYFADRDRKEREDERRIENEYFANAQRNAKAPTTLRSISHNNQS